MSSRAPQQQPAPPSAQLEAVEASDEDGCPWRRAVSRAVAEFAYGDIIPKAWLEEAFGVECPDVGTKRQFQAAHLKFFSAMQLFRDELLHAHKRALRSLGRGEWLIVMPREQAALAMDTAARGVDKALRVAEDIFDNVARDLLSLEEQRVHADAAGKLAAFRAMATKKLGAAAPTVLAAAGAVAAETKGGK